MTLSGIGINLNQPVVPQKGAAETAPQEAQVQPPAADIVERSSRKEDITIMQGIKGLAGAAVGAAVEGVGNTASSLVNLPKATFHAARTIWKTDMIGPNLKVASTLLLPVAMVATPVAVALGSVGYGMFRGATSAVEHGLGEVVKDTVKDVKHFHTDLAGKAVNELAQLETPHLGEGEKPFDIRPLDGAKGLATGIIGGVIDGVGVGADTLLKTPKALFKVLKSLLKSDDIGPVLKTFGTVLAFPAAALCAPLATVGGVVYGVYKGCADGYQKGAVESVGNRFHDVKEFHDMTSKLLGKLDD